MGKKSLLVLLSLVMATVSGIHAGVVTTSDASNSLILTWAGILLLSTTSHGTMWHRNSSLGDNSWVAWMVKSISLVRTVSLPLLVLIVTIAHLCCLHFQVLVSLTWFKSLF